MQIEVGRTKAKRLRTEIPSVPATPTTKTAMNEAQSFVRVGSPGPPSFIGATLQNFFQDALSIVSDKLKQSNEQLMSEVNERLKNLVDSVDKSFQVLLNNQEQLKQKVHNLELLVLSFSKSHVPSTSTFTDTQPNIPSLYVLFTLHDSLTSASIDITFTTTATPPTSIIPLTVPIFQTPPSLPYLILSSSTSQDSPIESKI